VITALVLSLSLCLLITSQCRGNIHENTSPLNVLADFCAGHESLSFAKTEIVVFNASFQHAADRAFKFIFNGTELQRAKE
jgi:hypothetical protein